MIALINKSQIKKIKTLSRRIFADDDTAYRKMLWEHARVKSCTQLKGVQIDLVIRHLERCTGQKGTAGYRPEASATSKGQLLRATAAQWEEIRKRWGLVSWVAKEWGTESKQAEDSLKKFLWRRFRVVMEWLTLGEAQKVIEGLKQMAARGKP